MEATEKRGQLKKKTLRAHFITSLLLIGAVEIDDPDESRRSILFSVQKMFKNRANTKSVRLETRESHKNSGLFSVMNARLAL